MKIYTVKLFLFFSLFIFLGCKKRNSVNVDQDKIYTDYQVFYDSNEGKTSAKAKFLYKNADGNALKLTGKSVVSFNDEQLSYNEKFNIYEKTFQGFVNTAKFKWMDKNKHSYSFDVKLFPLDFFYPDTLYKSIIYALKFAPPLQKSETLVLSVKPEGEGVPVIITASGEGDSLVYIYKDDLTPILSNTALLFVDRVNQYIPDEVTSAGGFITTTYRKSQLVYIK